LFGTQVVCCDRGEKTSAMGGLSWGQIYTGGSWEGRCASKHTRDIADNKKNWLSETRFVNFSLFSVYMYKENILRWHHTKGGCTKGGFIYTKWEVEFHDPSMMPLFSSGWNSTQGGYTKGGGMYWNVLFCPCFAHLLWVLFYLYKLAKWSSQMRGHQLYKKIEK
jgi:hypothetical protein